MWSCVINPFSCWGSDYRRKRNVELILLANDCSMSTGSMSSFFCSPEYDQKPLRLICRERVAEIKRYNVKRHYDSHFDQENELTFDNLVSICTESAPCVLVVELVVTIYSSANRKAEPAFLSLHYSPARYVCKRRLRLAGNNANCC